MKMTPSKQLDECIATKVLGWVPAADGGWRDTGGNHHQKLPHFSESGSAALIVLEKLRTKFDITQVTMNGLFYSVNILGHDEVSYKGYNKRFPLALAEAALKASMEMTTH
jgi:hypothetical protein